MTHYRWDGPAKGQPLLLIHGATVPMWQFNRLVEPLNVAGFRTLRLDLFGHGRSAYPRFACTLELFAQQVRELLDALSVDQPVHLLAHSMGAVVATRLASAEPRRMAKMILVAPMLDYMGINPNTRLLRWPLLGEALVKFYVVPMLKRRRQRRYRRIHADELVLLFNEQVATRGFRRALLSMFRHGTLSDQRAAYRALANSKNAQAMLVVRGTHDDVAPDTHMREICALLGGARLEQLQGLEHNLMISDPQRVAELVIPFLTSHLTISSSRAGK